MSALKRAACALCAALLLSLGTGALAADAGSAADPLLSKSYVRSWQEMLLADRAARANRAGEALITDGARSIQMLRSRCGERGMRVVSLPAGGQVYLQTGDSITILSGEAEAGGTLIDVTQGQRFSGGALAEGHRLIAAQDMTARVTARTDCRVSLTGTAVVSPYRDSSPAQWYGAAVDYAAVRQLMNGTGDGAFSPNSTLTRAMFVTILGRMAGVDAGKYGGAAFSDVAKGSWYDPYVDWAVKNGITNGTGGGRFEPDSPVTREQMATLIIRYADAAGITLPDGAGVRASFRDAGSISDWAFESVDRMRMTGLLTGDETGSFNPLSGATRAEAATVFMRLDATLQLQK